MLENVFLWGHPRSLSTAMELYFRARGDFRIIHEPFAESYWHHSDANEVLEQLLADAASPPVFVKDIAHHLPAGMLEDEALIRSFQHVVLFRAPLPTFHSHLKVNPEARGWEFGYETLYTLVCNIKRITGAAPVFMRAEDLQSSPARAIRTMCEQLNIPHNEAALSWNSEMNNDWRAGATWQLAASRSTGFNTGVSEALPPVPDNYREHFEHHAGFYERLLAEASSGGVRPMAEQGKV